MLCTTLEESVSKFVDHSYAEWVMVALSQGEGQA